MLMKLISFICHILLTQKNQLLQMQPMQQQLFSLLSHPFTIDYAYQIYQSIDQHAQEVLNDQCLTTQQFKHIPLALQKKEWARLYDQNGKMFGILIAQDEWGQQHYFKAFSGQLFGLWKIEDWVMPCFEPKDFWWESVITQSLIHQIGYKLENQHHILSDQDFPRDQLKEKRKNLSQILTRKIHQSYTFYDHLHQKIKLLDIMEKPMLGAGDCCTIKLLNTCFRLGLKPIGLCEFWVGKHKTKDQTLDGIEYLMGDQGFKIYFPCQNRCMPILKEMI
jgi:hypothetical protein